MSIPFFPAFFSQYPSSFARSKLIDTSLYSLNISSKFTSLASNSATNQFQIGWTCPPITPQRWPSIRIIFTTAVHSIASASNSSPNLISCLSWFSTCWPFSLEFASSSSHIYRLLHCLQTNIKTHLFCGANISGR